MKIVVLNGSPRPNGNTAHLVKAFAEGAEGKGHKVEIVRVGGMKIAPCLACEYCHTKGNGVCVMRDDMDKVWEALEGADMILLASAVHYWGFTGQLQSTITRFYCKNQPEGVKKYGLLLSSGSPDVYMGIEPQFKEIVGWFGAENAGILEFNGEDADQQSEANLAKARAFGASL